MSVETGALIDFDGEPIYWHTPNGRSGASLPDSRELWNIIWENRNKLLGFAHSHPGCGIPGPSYEDVTTFSAIELALGKRLVWWIVSCDGFVELVWIGPDELHYGIRPHKRRPSSYSWVLKLRELSEYSEQAIVNQ
jgi:proteasome lid subunit RPN8/RPN11